ncbi:MAG TPA: MerR family transcriptional regulator, partial [Polyangiaceae bacterium]
MAKERLTIGELAKRSGVPVKTLRYYEDEGIVPASSRSESGYRLYGEEALVRLDLVRTLREAGLGIESIRKVLRREMSLAEALTLRLAAIEAHVASLQRVGAALRAALRSEPTEDDIRRLSAVTRLSNEERKSVIEKFYDRVSEGIPIEEGWKKEMIAASTPKLPDDPTAAQLDAWIELAELVADDSFVEVLRASAKKVWGKVDMTLMRAASTALENEARALLQTGESPTSERAKRAIFAYGEAMARARGKTSFDAESQAGMRESFATHDPRATRYWELVGAINGSPIVEKRVDEWN